MVSASATRCCGRLWPGWAWRSQKHLRAAERDRGDMAEARRAWAEMRPKLDPSRLVFLDETWAELPKVPRAERVEGQRRA